MTKEERASYKYKGREREYKKEYNRKACEKIRYDVLDYYSRGIRCCAICGENDFRVLCIDHIDTNAYQQRKQLHIGCGNNFYHWLKRSGYPEGYQILCHNCNVRKEFDRKANNYFRSLQESGNTPFLSDK